MQQTVEWLCFTIGGILILTSVLTSIFKINVGGASVEGQSHWGQKIVAFVAGWIFVIIGGVFHGVGMYIAAAPASQGNIQPNSATESQNKSEGSVHNTTPAPTSATPTQKSVIDISGDWRSAELVTYHVTQTGTALQIDCANAFGQLIGKGSGTVDGRNVKTTLTFDVNGQRGRGSCRMQISDAADEISGTCRTGLGEVAENWTKIDD